MFARISLLAVAAAAGGLAAAEVAFIAGSAADPAPRPVAAETVEIAPGSFSFAEAGEFQAAGHTIVAPERQVGFSHAVRIMKYQVSLAEYRRCVEAGACQAPDNTPSDTAQVPVTGVSFRDAEAYAGWYSRVTGEGWRLPTSEEWAYAAAERFAGNRLSVAEDPKNPAIAWIRQYQEEAAIHRRSDPLPHETGFFGPDSKGVYDMAGNVWEWTTSCFARTTLSADRSRVEHRQKNCFVRIVEGAHRTYMSDFIRDAKSGGCAVGVPPDNLGFRLVHDEPGLLDSARRALRRLLPPTD